MTLICVWCASRKGKKKWYWNWNYSDNRAEILLREPSLSYTPITWLSCMAIMNHKTDHDPLMETLNYRQVRLRCFQVLLFSAQWCKEWTETIFTFHKCAMWSEVKQMRLCFDWGHDCTKKNNDDGKLLLVMKWKKMRGHISIIKGSSEVWLVCKFWFFDIQCCTITSQCLKNIN